MRESEIAVPADASRSLPRANWTSMSAFNSCRSEVSRPPRAISRARHRCGGQAEAWRIDAYIMMLAAAVKASWLACEEILLAPKAIERLEPTTRDTLNFLRADSRQLPQWVREFSFKLPLQSAKADQLVRRFARRLAVIRG